MRLAPLFGCLLLLFALAAPAAPPPVPAAAPPAPAIRYIIRDVEVRAGPSDRFYATNVLHRGDKVEVLHDGDGWLAIRPPEGSFSWIDTRYLQNVVPRQPNYVVTPSGAAVPVYLGSSVFRGQPTTEGARLQRGTQVRSIGAPQRAPDGRGDWMPIESPAAENRYLLSSAVTKEPPSEPATTVRTSALAASAASVPAPALNPDLLWRQAMQAEEERRIADAIRLYEAAGEANRTVNPDRSITAFDRARALQTGRPGTPGSAFVPARTDPDAGGLRIPGAPPVVAAPVAWNSGSPAAPAYAQPTPAAPTRLDPSSLPASAWQTGTYGPGWSPTGWLRRGYRVLEEQRTYVLEDTRGRPLYYILPQPGLDLEPHVGHNVDLYGSLVYRGDLRAWLMNASQAQTVP